MVAGEFFEPSRLPPGDFRYAVRYAGGVAGLEKVEELDQAVGVPFGHASADHGLPRVVYRDLYEIYRLPDCLGELFGHVAGRDRLRASQLVGSTLVARFGQGP